MSTALHTENQQRPKIRRRKLSGTPVRAIYAEITEPLYQTFMLCKGELSISAAIEKLLLKEASRRARRLENAKSSLSETSIEVERGLPDTGMSS